MIRPDNGGDDGRNEAWVAEPRSRLGPGAGECRGIARRLGRAPSTITREVDRNGGRGRYRAVTDDRAVWKAALRPKVAGLAARPELRDVVDERLRQRWSPQQIAGWLRRVIPTIRSGGCPKRRSTGRCLFSPEAR